MMWTGVILSKLGGTVPFSQEADAHVYTKEDFERHQRTEWSGTEEAKAQRLARCHATLELLSRAAARADGEPPRQRLPGWMDSFMQWCESAREDFKLGPAIDEQLARRKFRGGMTVVGSGIQERGDALSRLDVEPIPGETHGCGRATNERSYGSIPALVARTGTVTVPAPLKWESLQVAEELGEP